MLAFAALSGFLLNITQINAAQGADRPKAAERPRATATGNSAPSTLTEADQLKAERVDVETLKRKYWAKGDEYEMQVVQNRLYSKSGRAEISLFGGFVSADPFLSIKGAGGSIGFHFSEYFGAHLLAWKYMVSESTASSDFKKSMAALGQTVYPDSNEPQTFYGAEFTYSPIYGKLSVMGKAIIYYDFFVLAGGGLIKSESGSNPAIHLGVGQQIWLSHSLSFKAVYRIMRNNETLLKKTPALAGQKSISRENYSNVLMLGLSLLI